MPAEQLRGKLLSEKIQDELKIAISTHRQNGDRLPKLTVILVGRDPASNIYVNHKIKACEKTGIISQLVHLDDNTTEVELLNLIESLNQDKNTDGILVQMPIPSHISKEKVIEKILPHKDVDGFHPYNLGRLAQNLPVLRPCTPYGIIKLLQHYQIELKGLNAVVLGASTIVGRPLSLELLNAGCTVTTCHSKTKNLEQHIRQADVLISATGKRNLVNPDWIKPNSIVVDVGIHRLENNQICGDLDTAAISEKASFITPVPGGVGPMTVAVLLENTLTAYLNHISAGEKNAL